MRRALAARLTRLLGRGGAGDAQQVGLMRGFALTGAVAIAAFSIGMAALLAQFLETRLLVRDAAISRDFVQSIVTTQKVGRYLAAGDAVPDAAFVEFLAHVAALPDVLRTNVYSRDRRVLWSSRPEMIGQRFAANDELEQALRGDVVVHTASGGSDGKAEHMLLGGAARYVENYLPLYDERRQLVGVVELYREPVALFEAIRSGTQRVWLGSIAGGLLLFASLIWFVRRAERALQIQQSRLIEAEALAMVGEISAAVAHSIRNPLVSIRTSAELQRELGADDHGIASDMIRNVDRIEHLVRTLLTYASDPADRFASADLDAVLRDACARFGPELQAQGKALRTEIDAGLGAVDAEPVLLAQVFNSLLANAVEATRSGDQVTVRARRDGATALVEVCDSGGGIDARRLAEVFKPFHTSKPRGLGLGLALVRRSVQRLGGSVEVDSTPGAGTRFVVRLPLTKRR